MRSLRQQFWQSGSERRCELEDRQQQAPGKKQADGQADMLYRQKCTQKSLGKNITYREREKFLNFRSRQESIDLYPIGILNEHFFSPPKHAWRVTDPIFFLLPSLSLSVFSSYLSPNRYVFNLRTVQQLISQFRSAMKEEEGNDEQTACSSRLFQLLKSSADIRCWSRIFFVWVSAEEITEINLGKIKD